MDRAVLSEAIIQDVSAIVADEVRAAGPALLTGRAGPADGGSRWDRGAAARVEPAGVRGDIGAGVSGPRGAAGERPRCPA